MLKDFRDWISKGNLVELAVAVVLGTAFAVVIKALVDDFVTPLIAAIGGKPDFAALTFTVNGSTFRYGDFLNAFIAFVIVGFVLFLVVKAMLRLVKEKAAEPDPQVEALNEIKSLLAVQNETLARIADR